MTPSMEKYEQPGSIKVDKYSERVNNPTSSHWKRNNSTYFRRIKTYDEETDEIHKVYSKKWDTEEIENR